MQIAAADVVVAFSRRVIEFRTGESEEYDLEEKHNIK